MKNIYILTKAMIKGIGFLDFSGGDKPGKKKLGRILLIGLMVFALLYFSGLAVGFVFFANSLLAPLEVQSIIIGLLVSGISFLTFFFGIFHVLSVYYYSKDIEKILPLPVKAGEIILAKFFTSLIYEYLPVLLFFLPSMITYAVINSMGPIFYIYMLIVALLLPIVPLVIASVIIMLIMRLTPLMQNKDRLSVFAGILGLFLGLGLNFFINKMTSSGSSEEELALFLSDKGDYVARLMGKIFPGTSFANMALSKPENILSLAYILGFILVALAFGLLIYLAGNTLYLKGVIGISQSSGKGRAKGSGHLKYLERKSSPLSIYVKKELWVLFRTPIFFMNNVLMNFLMPAFLLLPFLANGNKGAETEGFSLTNLRQLLEEMGAGGPNKVTIYVMLAFFAMLSFTFGTNGLTETAISREGKQSYIMKIIPMAYILQIKAKVLTGLLISSLGALLMTLIFTLVLRPSPTLFLLCLASLPGAVLFPNIGGMFFDLLNPKIKWDNEQRAVKQNFNVLLGIVLGLVLIAIVALPVLIFDMGFVFSVIYIIISPFLLSILAWVLLNRIASKYMIQLAP